MAAFGKDRTNELLTIVQNRSKGPRPARKTTKTNQFAEKSVTIGKYLNQTQKKLHNFSQLANKNSLFDDQTDYVNALITAIKQDLGVLKKETEEIIKVKALQRQWNKQTQSHAEVITSSLSTNLQDMTKEFSDALTKRSQVTKEQYRKVDNLTGVGAPALRQRKSTFAPAETFGTPSSDKLGTVFIPMSSSGQSVLSLPTQRESRTGAVEKIESTIGEIGKMFQQLAGIVAEQGEVLNRIDANVEDTVANASSAQNHLLKYKNAISSYRGLIIRLFIVTAIIVVLLMYFYS
eukprot:TRINITY_DN5996_c0_g1_i1.p1 TRINITY_DN5996_c0_g1~~TRINITY_DN5996_c0_g1_i1.p1  ORF type:complete len:291 (+),score=55.60 TRINITY_DN5996_c0_g1_i1:79-951(+)